MGLFADSRKVMSKGLFSQSRKTISAPPVYFNKEEEPTNEQKIAGIRNTTKQVQDTSAMLLQAAKSINNEQNNKLMAAQHGGYEYAPPAQKQLSEFQQGQKFVPAALAKGALSTVGGILNIGSTYRQALDEQANPLHTMSERMKVKVPAMEQALATNQQRIESMPQERSQLRSNIEQLQNKAAEGLTKKQTSSLGYGITSSIPQMATLFVPGGQSAFFASAAGNYATEAEKSGASPEKALAYGLAGGAAELAGERLLYLIPQSVRKAGTGIVSRILKAGGGEAAQEAITGPIMAVAEKMIYNPDREWTVDDWKQMGNDALAGGIMGVVFMGLASKDATVRTKTEAAVKEAQQTNEGVSIEAAHDLVKAIKASKSVPLSKQFPFDAIRKQLEEERILKEQWARNKFEEISADPTVDPEVIDQWRTRAKDAKKEFGRTYDNNYIRKILGSGRYSSAIESIINGNNQQGVSVETAQELVDAIRNSSAQESSRIPPTIPDNTPSAEPVIVGTGRHTGDVQKIGDKVYKSATRRDGVETKEAEVYTALSGSEGIAPGKPSTVNGKKKIELPYYRKIISRDEVKKDDAKKFTSGVAVNIPRIIKAVQALTNKGYRYSDPLQFGVGRGGDLDLLDFSNASKVDIDEALDGNMADLERFFQYFGLDKQADIIQNAMYYKGNAEVNTIQDISEGMTLLNGDILDVVNQLKRAGDMELNNIYYATNAREIQAGGLAQTEPIDGIKYVYSDKKLPESVIYEWELTPLYEAEPTQIPANNVAEPTQNQTNNVEIPTKTGTNNVAKEFVPPTEQPNKFTPVSKQKKTKPPTPVEENKSPDTTKEFAPVLDRAIAEEAFERTMSKMGYKTLSQKSNEGQGKPKNIKKAGLLIPDMYMDQSHQFRELEQVYLKEVKKDKAFSESVKQKYDARNARTARDKVIEKSFELNDWQVPRDIFIERGGEYNSGRKTSDIHKEAVQNAIRRGEAIPDAVKNDYPELFATTQPPDGGINLQQFAKEHGDTISKAYLNTFKKNGWDVSQPEIFNSDNFTYNKLSEITQLKTAKDAVAKDADGETNRLEDLDKTNATVNDTNIAFELLNANLEKLNNNPNDREAFYNVQMLSEKAQQFGLEAGRIVQAFAKYGRTPAGTVAYAQKAFDAVAEALPTGQQEKYTKETNAVSDAFGTIETDVANAVASELDGTPVTEPVKQTVNPEIKALEDAANLADADAIKAGRELEKAKEKTAEAQKRLADATNELAKQREQAKLDTAIAKQKLAEEKKLTRAEISARKRAEAKLARQKAKTEAEAEAGKGIWEEAFSTADKSFEQILSERIAKLQTESKPTQKDPVKDLLDELYRKAKESPIDDINTKANKARNPIEFAIQALDSWGRYDQVYNDAKAIVKERFKDNPEALARMEEFFKDNRKAPLSDQTLSSIIRKGMSEVGVSFKDMLNPAKQKALVNHILDSSGVSGDVAMSLRNFLMAEFKTMGEKVKTTPANKQDQMLGSLFETALKKEFAPEQAKKILEAMVSGTKTVTQKVKSLTNRSISQIVKDYQATGKRTEKQIIDEVISKTGLSGKDASDLRAILAGQFKAKRAEYSKKYAEQLLAEKKVIVKDPAAFIKKIVEMSNTGAIYMPEVQALVKEKYGIPTMTSKDIQYIMKGMEEYNNITTEKAKEAKYKEMLKYIANKLPRNALDAYRSWSKTAMLLLPSTHLANLGGNYVNYKMEQGTDALSWAIERAIPKDQRTKAFLTKSDQGLKTIAENDWLENGDRYMELSDPYKVKGLDGIKRFGDTFNPDTAMGKFGNATSGLVTKGLNLGDKMFFGPAYKSYLAQIMKARGLTEVTPEAKAYALDKAKSVTLRSKNVLADGINNFKRLPGIGKFVDIAVPFVNTPSNVLAKAIDGSPFGLATSIVKSIINVLPNTKGTYTQAQMIESWVKFFSGTIGGAGLGALLQAMGLIDYDEKDGLTAEILGKKYTIDWIQPAAMQLAFGASAYKKMKDKGFSGDALYKSILAGGNTVFNMSVLKSVKDIFGSKYDDGPTEAIMAVPGQGIMQAFPTPLTALAKTIDTTTRSTYDPNPLMSTAKFIASKTPGLSMTLPKRIGPLGEEVKNENALGLFVLPGRVIPASYGPIADEVKKQGLALKDAVKYWDVTKDGKTARTILTAKQYEEFATEVGKRRALKLKELFDGVTKVNRKKYADLSPDEKVDEINAIVEEANKFVKDAWKKKIGSAG